MAEKINNKYIIIKTEDLKNLTDSNEIHGYTRYDDVGRVDIKDEKLQQDIDAFNRVLKMLEHGNQYLCINLDKPYAEPMWSILLAFEDLKKEIEFKDKKIELCKKNMELLKNEELV